MCYKLFDSNFTESPKNSQEILTLIAYKQFVFQEKAFNNFARNYYIFTDLWYRLPSAQHIDVLKEIEFEIGIPYENALFFAYALAGNKSGHFWIYDEEKINEFNAKIEITFQLDSHEKFVKWCSGDYETILKEKHLLPPFVIHPIIETKTKPTKKDGEVFMIASPHYIHDKVTYGLYFTLIDRFNKGGCNNKFKELFGIVFQEYVGELIKFYFKTWEIIPEIKYKKGKHNFQDSIDWFILKDDKLIMIEVKQSSLFLKSKYNPSIKGIKSDLKKTIIEGVKQLEVSEKDIKSQKYLDLQKFNNVTSFVKLVVVNDPIYNANFIVKTLMKDEVDNLNFQVININEFETLLSNQNEAESLFDTLYFKGIKYNEMDFKEFIIAMFPDSQKRVEFLEPIWDRFFSKVESSENKST